MSRRAIVPALPLQGLAAAACKDRAAVTGPTPTGVAAAKSISGAAYNTAHRLLSGARVEVIEGAVIEFRLEPSVAP